VPRPRPPSSRPPPGGPPPRRRVAAAARATPESQGGRVEKLIVDLWGRTRIDWGFAATRLPAVVRQERWLSNQDRREVLETVYGMVRQSRRIDFALETSRARLPPGSARELARYLAFRVLEGKLEPARARAVIPEIDWAAVAAVDERIGHERDAAHRFALAASLPDWLGERLIAQYGDEAVALGAALNERAPVTLRANTLRASRNQLIARLTADGVEARPTPLARHGVLLAERVDTFGLAAYKEGLFEVQDEGSQLIAELVAPSPKGIVLDACAGTGGKTLALAAAMEGKGRLLAVDVDARKLEELKKRARRAGLSSVQAMHTGADVWPNDVGALMRRFDRVLVDSPCTGIGSLRRNPELRWRLTPEDVAGFAIEQEQLARRGAELLAPGGRLIYATCSLLRDENEAVVERVLAGAHLELLKVVDVLGADRAAATSADGTFLTTLPHRHGTDGFFAAVLQRKD